MRLQLARAVAVVVCAGSFTALSSAWADDVVHMRGQYYKERTTTVLQPTVDISKDLGRATTMGGHLLIDQISAASVAAGKSARFTERRYEGGLRLSHLFGETLTLAGGMRVSSEPDYKSTSGNLGLSVDLFDRHSTFAVNTAHSFDDISDAATGALANLDESLRTHYFGFGWTQVLSPNLLGQVGYDLFVQDGFLGNAYRVVVAGGVIVDEEVPSLRLRNAAYANLRAFEPASQLVVHAGYRLYFDDWGIIGHTPEVSLTRELFSERLELRARYRYYSQNAAEFYRDVYDRQELFMTDDEKLSPFDGHTFGGRATLRLRFLDGTALRRFSDGDAALVYERVLQNNRFGNANILAASLTLPY